MADLDLDVTPDLDMSLNQDSSIGQKSRCKMESFNNSLDSVNIMSLTQDVTVGTQNPQLSSNPFLKGSQNDTPSEALTTSVNTVLLDSPPTSQKTQKYSSVSVPLHSGMDVEEESSELLVRSQIFL